MLAESPIRHHCGAQAEQSSGCGMERQQKTSLKGCERVLLKTRQAHRPHRLKIDKTTSRDRQAQRRRVGMRIEGVTVQGMNKHSQLLSISFALRRETRNKGHIARRIQQRTTEVVSVGFNRRTPSRWPRSWHRDEQI